MTEVRNEDHMAKASMKCPECGFVKKVDIPETSCMVFWKCPGCGKMISAPKGECCVICAYSDKKCPVHGD